MQAQTIENVFARSWDLLSRNWIIIVPGIVVGVVAAVVSAIVNPVVVDPITGLPHGNTLGGAFALIVSLLAQTITIAYTTGMAGAAWQRGTTGLDDGSAAFREDAGRIFGAIVLYAVIAIVLAIFTLGIGALLFAFFAFYAMPAVVLDNLGPVAALRRSAGIAQKAWLTTLIVIAIIAIVGVGVGFVAIPLAVIPFLGPIISAVVLQSLICFVSIVVVGEYFNLRGAPADPIVPPPGPVV